jgi:hypothetical protein
MPDSEMEAAWRVIKRAEAHGCTFKIEAGRLAIEFPERIDQELWRSIQFDVLEHKLMIAGLVHARAELERERRHG